MRQLTYTRELENWSFSISFFEFMIRHPKSLHELQDFQNCQLYYHYSVEMADI